MHVTHECEYCKKPYAEVDSRSTWPNAYCSKSCEAADAPRRAEEDARFARVVLRDLQSR